ncbi:MAG: hypothetical protein ACKVQA_11810 [Burkholderiales bacterium]
MEPLDIYVVRIYRRHQEGLDGIVQPVQGSVSTAFHSAEQLWQALLAPMSLREHSSIDNPENT